jgi:ABC-type multidrug transport system fused ATPase/permease subunit
MVTASWKLPGTGSTDTEPLLESGLLQGHDNNYSIIADDDSDSYSDEDQDVREGRAQRLRETGGWIGYITDFGVFLPYIIPRKDRLAQFCISISIATIVAQRVLRVAIPWILGIISDKVALGTTPSMELAIYFVFDILAGDSGIHLIQGLTKIPIQQYSYRKITNAAFNHVMAQSIDFHSTQDSAEVMKAIEQGFALGNVLEGVVFEIIPIFTDVLMACVMFYRKFNSTVALILLTMTFVYLGAEALSSRLTTSDRRRVTRAERAQIRKMHQAVQGWQTVTFFNQFQKEARTLAVAINEHLSAKSRFDCKQEIYKACVNLLFPTTFFGLATLILREIATGQATLGDFVFFLMYWDTIQYPIQFLTEHFRWMVTDFVDAERLLMLLKTKPSISDSGCATPLEFKEGRIEFQDVSLVYDGDRPALSRVSFVALPGETIALVGQTGAGKSSILKLLLRLYEVTSGSIRIADHDIRSVTLSSLRDVIGVVPQNPMFFNASIMENLRYARSNATDDEVYAACHAAAIHNTIIQYDRGYDTRIGENGVKLSGGEAQRLAFARVLLKDAPIVLLDEATSAVDTMTEGRIQKAFDNLRQDRIVIVIAHRLRTIVRADQILVFNEGSIVERGSHESLCNKRGRYWELWENC